MPIHQTASASSNGEHHLKIGRYKTTWDPFGSTSTGRALYVEVNSPGPLDRQSPASYISFPMISGACQGVPHSASQAESGPPVAEVDADNRMYTGLMRSSCRERV